MENLGHFGDLSCIRKVGKEEKWKRLTELTYRNDQNQLRESIKDYNRAAETLVPVGI